MTVLKKIVYCISDCIRTLEQNETKPATATKILIEIEDLVLEDLNQETKNQNFNIEVFKDTWGRRINESRKALKISNKNATVSNKAWNVILNKASTATTTSNSAAAAVSASAPPNYDNIKSKWKLKSGRCVEDLIYNTAKKFKVEHPAHSFILYIQDDTWVDVFSKEELEEIEDASNNKAFYEDLPINIFNMVSKLDRKKKFNEIYETYKDLKADRYEEPELFWTLQSILEYIDLFYDGNKIDVDTEQDLLDDVYGFIKKNKKLCNLTSSNASGSSAFSEAKNKKRKISSSENLSRQKNADCFDLVFKRFSTEIGCIEIGLDDEGPNGTKFLQEKGLKTPRMMKTLSLRILDQYPTSDIGGVKIVGMVVSGLYITCLKMSLVGSVSVLSSSERLKMPESISEVPSLLPPALALVYNCAQIMKCTGAYLEEVTSTFSLERPKTKSSLPPCFFIT